MSSMYAECCWPDYQSHYFFHWDKACLKHLVKRNLLWRDFKTFLRRAWLGFRVIQPLGCKSYWWRSTRVGRFARRWYRPQWYYEWTINVCEWLENKAREKEMDDE